ncbi:DoxX family protein [Geodermatophilus ruber]|uniref:Putative oxidoreductase n=1 Tax=Geodermatophilus ruber TaxID=504800 RepID=A0A1I4EV15_9ACTN|nr:DoxX family protein [Geodermatophilus ruber]SFL08376.1 putative oxidoreductase [Geodermatophilus ruber]
MNITDADPFAAARIGRLGSVSTGLLILRLAVGLLLLEHGLPKLTDPSGFLATVEGLGVPLPQVAGWLEILGEVGLGLLILLGLLTRIAGALLAVMMGLVWITVHAPLGFVWGQGFDGEAALLLALLGVVLAFTGAGTWSVDAALGRRRRRRRLQA